MIVCQLLETATRCQHMFPQSSKLTDCQLVLSSLGRNISWIISAWITHSPWTCAKCWKLLHNWESWRKLLIRKFRDSSIWLHWIIYWKFDQLFNLPSFIYINDIKVIKLKSEIYGRQYEFLIQITKLKNSPTELIKWCPDPGGTG